MTSISVMSGRILAGSPPGPCKAVGQWGTFHWPPVAMIKGSFLFFTAFVMLMEEEKILTSSLEFFTLSALLWPVSSIGRATDS